MRPAIFLDRDGVIIQNRDQYVRAWEDVHFLPLALEALANLANSPYRIVIVTNQSAVGRGLISLATAEQINQQVIDTIHQFLGRIDGVYLCPHAPQDDCECRKPKPGLLSQAAEELDLDLNRSILVGDALTDLQAGISAGIPRRILVLTGRGAEQQSLPRAAQLLPFEIYPSLFEAAQAILAEENSASLGRIIPPDG
jgi:D-glycero-D-manno-heptose 1,7-bisphosphate phosphatase